MNLRTLWVTALILALGACAGVPGTEQATSDFLRRQAIAAANAQAAGNLHEALTLWRTVTVVEPANTEALAAIHALKGIIEDETRAALGAGAAAYTRGNNREGDRWMLRALALSPGEASALGALRRSVSEASHDRQAEKIASAYVASEAAEPAPEPAPETSTRNPAEDLQRLFNAGDFAGFLRVAKAENGIQSEYSVLIRDAHLALAGQARDANQPEQQLMHLDQALAAVPPGERLRQERNTLADSLSDEYYRRSLALLKTDLQAAIVALEKSIAFNPDNLSAKDKLDQAQTLKRNLEKIQGR